MATSSSQCLLIAEAYISDALFSLHVYMPLSCYTLSKQSLKKCQESGFLRAHCELFCQVSETLQKVAKEVSSVVSLTKHKQ